MAAGDRHRANDDIIDERHVDRIGFDVPVHVDRIRVDQRDRVGDDDDVDEIDAGRDAVCDRRSSTRPGITRPPR